MGFALSLQIQLMATAAAAPLPQGAAATAEEGPVPASTTPAVTVAVPSVPPTVPNGGDATPASLQAPGPSILVGTGGAIGLGISSGAVALGRVLGSVEWSHAALELAAEISTPSTTRQPDGAGFSQQQVLAGLAGCGMRRPWSVCLVGKVGEIRVAGQGIDFPATATGLVVQAGFRLGVTHMLGSRFQIGARAEALALITQGIITLDSKPAWTAPRLGALFGADVGIRFR